MIARKTFGVKVFGREEVKNLEEKPNGSFLDKIIRRVIILNRIKHGYGGTL